MTNTTARATAFHALHTNQNQPLLLANVWDVASARLVESAGAHAVATTSAGIAWALGRPDGNSLLREEAVAATARITAALSVPVTVDIEAGYADDADGVERTVNAVLEAGAVGINIEDGALAPDELVDRIKAARRGADRVGIPLFINARTDVYLADLVAPDHLLRETVGRARRYLDAGANGVFVPGLRDVATIESVVESVDGPLNVMVGPGAPSVAELARVGVARVSLGSGVAQAAYAVARGAATELLRAGTYSRMAPAIDYSELNALF
ncbi:isocitrate lyase/phosphoenolpyruvate mutase family protein [Microbacterium sp. SORGH_AS_0888]|uniref:isocitrate lyase/PEP mutase family protein n=1 Tax=Microbacterium sp. SORGH_AS_0888 TaxID=3041791 RepID=UPI002789A98D|nr:isocitrate lyase/phosphoenolpyruvate mutase family protein [Microbacterium sp. SORGH_AS_0888]MDQ1128261.1 2-methylisocitrate lyase-like PEP mutase family enzyme [Microbacterium sp. SORGH_AS_0888]